MKKKLLTLAAAIMLVFAIGMTANAASGWQQQNGNWYYYNADGSQASGWLHLGNYWYYLNPARGNIMCCNEVYRINEKLYWFDENGHMLSNKWYELKFTDDSSWYYFGSDGAIVTGWKKIGNYWYYFDPGWEGEMIRSGLCQIDGGYYAFHDNGHMYENEWYSYPDPEGEKYYWLYYGEGGKEASGWKKIGGYWYYFDPDDDNFMHGEGWEEIDGKGYYFDEKGRMAAGKWIYYASADAWCYYKTDGSEASGWEKIGGKWYYLDPEDDNFMLSDVIYEFDNGDVYAFNKGGDMAVNIWAKDASSGEWYLIGSNGKAMTGWQKVDGAWYYLDPSSKVMYAGGTYKIGGKNYTFASSGKWLY